MSAPDVLFPLRNNFYLGSFQAAINESNVRGLGDSDAVEKDSFVYRSYIALGQHKLVIDEISDAAPTALQAVKLLALYLSGGAQKDKALSGLLEWLSDSAVSSNPTLLLIAGMINTHEQNYNEALKYTHVGGTLDLCALNVQIYLKMHRPDYAEKQLKIMQQIDEDHTLTQLANAWVNLSLGGAKVQEAYYIFQELCEKYTRTVMLMNGSAVCQMHMGQFEEAESLLLEALNKDSKDANTLANLLVCSLHLSKPTARYLSQLKITHPNHVLVERAAAGEAAFERAVQSVS
jgi:coatomer protein complex subunit epsilon